MKKFLFSIVALLALSGVARADEGMWLPSLIGDKIKDMQAKGFRLTAEDIYSINQASMKDCSPWGRKESDTIEQLNNNKITEDK